MTTCQRSSKTLSCIAEGVGRIVGERLGVKVAVGVGGRGEGVVVGVRVAVDVGEAGMGVKVAVLVGRLVGTDVSVGRGCQTDVTVLHARLASSKNTIRMWMRVFMLSQMGSMSELRSIILPNHKTSLLRAAGGIVFGVCGGLPRRVPDVYRISDIRPVKEPVRVSNG